MKKLALHWQILIGMLAGVLFGLLAVSVGWVGFVVDWIKPFGTIFINLLKLIAVPLIVGFRESGAAQSPQRLFIISSSFLKPG
ncbi:MAG: cation:dicarboxylase symporter family transporter [Lewinellaceae bacterium]|nr:cation:dicarboxylase symporter family transporter [Lewinellaceae bacterium]